MNEEKDVLLLLYAPCKLVLIRDIALDCQLEMILAFLIIIIFLQGASTAKNCCLFMSLLG